MINKNIVITAVAIAAVVIIVAGAVVLLNNNNDSRKGDETGRLEVYGNANNDDLIDRSDVKALEDFMKSGWDRVKYPFADADGDGEITQKDVDIVNKVLNGEKVTLQYKNGKGEVKSVQYPVTGFVIGGTAVHAMINALDATDKALAKTGQASSLDSLGELDAPTRDLPSVGENPYKIDMELVSKIEGVSAVFTLCTSTYDGIEDAVRGTYVDCIRIDPDDTNRSVQTFLLVGFLTGHSDRAKIIADFYDRWNADISKKVATIKDSDKKTTLTMYTSSIAGYKYYLAKNTVSAGAINLSDFDENTRSIKDNREWAAVDKYQAEYIVQYLEMGFDPQYETKAEMQKAFEKYGKYLDLMKAYPDKYFIVNKNIPDIARVGYVAQYLYPDVFGNDYGEKLYEELVKTFYPYIKNFDVSKSIDIFDKKTIDGLA